MKKFMLKNVILIIAAALIFSACEKDDNDSDNQKAVTVMVNASSYTNWVYYSLVENKEVVVSDPASSTNWDLAIMRNHFRTNSGTTGSGLGGALDAGVVDFDSYGLAPETGYTVDSIIQAFDLATMEYYPIDGNTVLETWGAFTDEMPPILEPSNKVFVVKTALGNYAKIIVQNYYGTQGSGYITFKYVYQPNGSTSLL